MVRELLSLEEIRVAPAPSNTPAMATGETTTEFLDACCRLLDLLETPRDIPFLSGLIQREAFCFGSVYGPEHNFWRSPAPSPISQGRPSASHPDSRFP